MEDKQFQYKIVLKLMGDTLLHIYFIIEGIRTYSHKGITVLLYGIEALALSSGSLRAENWLPL